MELRPQIRQTVRELVDLRLIHLLDDNTSKLPSDGRRYEAYIIDIGLYENSRPRNFTQIEPGQADDIGRRDKLRASPLFLIPDEANDLEDENAVTQDPLPLPVPKIKNDNSKQLDLSFDIAARALEIIHLFYLKRQLTVAVWNPKIAPSGL